MSPQTLIERARTHQKLLWGVSLRITGCAADADEVVQDTYVKLLERFGVDERRPLRPYLLTVAVNLARDRLRRRKRAGYVGPFLPSLVEAGEEALPLEEPVSTERRYELLESVSVAFLLALEALTPKQRAALVLFEVAGLPLQEVAQALHATEGAVKVLLHRARARLAAYDVERISLDGPTAERDEQLLMRFLMCLQNGDAEGLKQLMASDAQAISDGGGEFLAARVVVHGAERIAKLYLHLAEHRGLPVTAEIRRLSGRAALVATLAEGGPNDARQFVLSLEVGKSGRITHVLSFMATRALAAVRFDGAGGLK
ncbi:MAG: sigma-70 family RNA polymerase sigma factor [Myxococcaceae bacterium]|nr:sigma-70 family RNA polymerase sigma factor [Myxococcaceae bacterium]